jgi:p-aminobenzoyl-glutamate transporter AbgT
VARPSWLVCRISRILGSSPLVKHSAGISAPFLAIFNLYVTGTGAKWAMLAPIFVPLRTRVAPDAVPAG